jgi:hypothetical protein
MYTRYIYYYYYLNHVFHSDGTGVMPSGPASSLPSCPPPGIYAMRQLPSYHVPRDYSFLPSLEKNTTVVFQRLGWSMSLNSVSTSLSEFCLDPSLRPLRVRGFLVATVCKFFSFGDFVREFLFVYYYIIICLGLLLPHLVLLWDHIMGDPVFSCWKISLDTPFHLGSIVNVTTESRINAATVPK